MGWSEQHECSEGAGERIYNKRKRRKERKMDNRRLNTQQALTSGILEKPAPESKLPKNYKKEELHHVSEHAWSEEELRDGLEKGGLDATMYYGCWRIWKVKDKFCGELMQYRMCTASFKNEDIDFALQQAVEWAEACQG
jgi:hypothetical protein